MGTGERGAAAAGGGWADDVTVVGVTPDGSVAVSQHSGQTWTESGQTQGPPQAVGTSRPPGGSLRILVVTSDGVLESSDGGLSFGPLELNRPGMWSVPVS